MKLAIIIISGFFITGCITDPPSPVFNEEPLKSIESLEEKGYNSLRIYFNENGVLLKLGNDSLITKDSSQVEQFLVRYKERLPQVSATLIPGNKTLYREVFAMMSLLKRNGVGRVGMSMPVN